jgi:hypothetical protein
MGTLENKDVHEKGKFPLTFAALFWLVVGLSAFAYVRLSHNALAFRVAILAIGLAELGLLISAYRRSSELEIAFEAAYFGFVFSLVLFARNHSIVHYPGLFVPAVFYRPYYLSSGNRPLAVALAVLILAMILPPAAGLVTISTSIHIMTWVSAFSVLCLWLFCSKLGGWPTFPAES